MGLIGSSIVGTDSLGQLFGRKQAIGLDNIALAVDPFGFNRVELWALLGQEERENTHAVARQLNLLIVPVALKPLITLRTVGSSQPSWWAMAMARSPRELASRIWQRRKTKVSDERNPYFGVTLEIFTPAFYFFRSYSGKPVYFGVTLKITTV